MSGSTLRLMIRDARRAVHGTAQGGFADATVGSLAAEPETIEELDAAVRRFAVPPPAGGFFHGFAEGENDEPHDAGVVVIDLPARLVVYQASDHEADKVGYVLYFDGEKATEVPVEYRLSDDWHLTRTATGWRELAERRRAEAVPTLDARAVLYGRPLLDFVVAECLARRGVATEEDDRAIHARWLLTPRDDLRGRAPRDLLLEKKGFIGWDLEYRARQWSEQGECPPGLDRGSRAFRLAGFGTHEIVKYYDLVRLLLRSCRRRLEGDAGPWGDADVAAEVARLEDLRQTWLDTPDRGCQGRTPREVIDHERARLPEGVTGHEAMVDHDCPVCEMMAEIPGPFFWHLDGCNMDDEFAFSFHRTQEEWDAERREWEDFDRRYAEKQERLGPPVDSVWKRSFAAPYSPGMPAGLFLTGVAVLLGELTEDLKGDEGGHADRLRRDFGNLREVAQGEEAAALLGPVVERFCEALDEAAAAGRPDLGAKCEDLGRRLRRFVALTEGEDGDLPF